MERLGFALCLAMLAVAPAHAAGDPACKLCAPAQEQAPKAPLQIQVDKGIDFSRFAEVGSGGGQAAIDPQTGTRTARGNLMGLGGLAYQGHARITGQPDAYVRIEMPPSVVLYSSSGAEVELSDFRTDLPAAPMLDAHGALEFNFGATLQTRRPGGGNFRGRIPIRIEYN
jgi:hypothetical protein